MAGVSIPQSEYRAHPAISSMVENNWITLTMYPGDRTADVFKYDKTGRPVAYINCKVNIIDAGW